MARGRDDAGSPAPKTSPENDYLIGINWTGPRLVGWDFTVAEVLNRLAHALREGPYASPWSVRIYDSVALTERGEAVMNDSPAVARRRVRLALRRKREARGLTQSQVADEMEWSLSKVMRIESGEVTVAPNDLRPLLAYLGVTDPEMSLLVEAAKVSRQRGPAARAEWWDEAPFRDHMSPAMRQLARYETEATAIRYFYSLVIPGPLQIPEYARAVMENYRGEIADGQVEMTDDRVDTRIEARARRHRQLLERRDPPRIYALVDESALLRQIGGPEVLGEQLNELLRMINDDRLMVRIVPLTRPAPGLGTYDLLYLGDDQAPDAEEYAVMYRESDLLDEIVEDVEKLRRHRVIFERLWHAVPDEHTSARQLAEQVRKLQP